MRKSLLFTIIIAATVSLGTVAQVSSPQEIFPSFFFWSANGDLQLDKVETYVFNAEIFGDTAFIPDATEADSVLESRTEFEYEGNMIAGTTYGWDDGEWDMQIRMEMYATDTTRIDSMLMFSPDTLDTGWARAFKLTFTYENDRQTMMQSYLADSLSGDWELYFQTSMYYDAMGNLTEEISVMKIDESSVLDTVSRMVYHYDENARLDSTYGYVKYPGVEEWMQDSKTLYYYNENGMPTHEEEYMADLLGTGWTPVSRTVYLVDEEVGKYYEEMYNWDVLALEWNLLSTDSLLYNDENLPLVEIIKEKPMPDDTLYLHQKTYFTYGDATTAPKLDLASQVLVYPNPASDVLNVKTQSVGQNSLQLFNLSGQLIYENQFYSSETQVPVRNLQKGSYLIKVRSAQKVHTQVILVR